jgi:leucyl aminopeptidase
MLKIFLDAGDPAASRPVPLHATTVAGLEQLVAQLSPSVVRWLQSSGFTGRDGELVLVPGEGDSLSAVVLGLGTGRDPHALAALSERLPSGIYRLGRLPEKISPERAAYSWALGAYSFDRYRARPRKEGDRPRLVLPANIDGRRISRMAQGVYFARDLVNTPSNDMGPAELEGAAGQLAKRFGAELGVTTGENLLAANYPMIHAVGRGSARAPRLIDLRWGDESRPKVTLVGKGVCFDSGGLDIKNASGMATMKKDMGGGACVLGLAQMIMDANLPVRLRVLVPAVENSISGDAFRPGDVFPTRKGLNVEIGNTDAEGRLVLADALAEADTETPELLICIATLTGAARMATGMEVPPFFTDDEKLASDLAKHAEAEYDPLWRLPLWRSYEDTIESTIADLNNNPDYGLAGSITAALFLCRFVTETKRFVHFDIPAWIDRPKPGRRKGAEANTIRALYALIEERWQLKA